MRSSPRSISFEVALLGIIVKIWFLASFTPANHILTVHFIPTLPANFNSEMYFSGKVGLGLNMQAKNIPLWLKGP